MNSAKSHVNAASGAVKESIGHLTGNQHLEDQGADQYAQAQYERNSNKGQSTYSSAIVDNVDPSFGNQDPSSVTNANISQGKVNQNS